MTLKILEKYLWSLYKEILKNLKTVNIYYNFMVIDPYYLYF